MNTTDPLFSTGKAKEVQQTTARAAEGVQDLNSEIHSQETEFQQREPLATTFACLFCNHENSVVVKLDKKLGLGDLSCKVCGQKFQTGINCTTRRSTCCIAHLH